MNETIPVVGQTVIMSQPTTGVVKEVAGGRVVIGVGDNDGTNGERVEGWVRYQWDRWVWVFEQNESLFGGRHRATLVIHEYHPKQEAASVHPATESQPDAPPPPVERDPIDDNMEADLEAHIARGDLRAPVKSGEGRIYPWERLRAAEQPTRSGEEKEAGEEVHAVDLVDELCEAVRSRDYSRNDMKGYDRVVMARKAILDRLSLARPSSDPSPAGEQTASTSPSGKQGVR